MKQTKKIVLAHLPPPVEQALREHLRAMEGLEIYSLETDMPDLVITGSSRKEIHLPGCPVLPVPSARRHRLGDLLRQAGQMLAQPVLYIDDFSIGPYLFKPQEKSLATETGEEIPLTDREVDVLAYLARHGKNPVARDALLKDVWQYQEGVDTHTLETHIYRLRQKMETSAEDPRLLLTVEGGYCLNA